MAEPASRLTQLLPMLFRYFQEEIEHSREAASQ